MLILRWLGRGCVGGVTPGTALRIEGTVSEIHGVTVVLNPLFELIASP